MRFQRDDPGFPNLAVEADTLRNLLATLSIPIIIYIIQVPIERVIAP